MGWAIGSKGSRDIGYGVPAICDQPRCREEIDRGISFACGGFRHDAGCGQYFCYKHLFYATDEYGESAEFCDHCAYIVEHPDGYKDKECPPYHEPKQDLLKWVIWKLYHNSWKEWRLENPEEVTKMRNRVDNAPKTAQKLIKQMADEPGFEPPKGASK